MWTDENKRQWLEVLLSVTEATPLKEQVREAEVKYRYQGFPSCGPAQLTELSHVFSQLLKAVGPLDRGLAEVLFRNMDGSPKQLLDNVDVLLVAMMDLEEWLPSITEPEAFVRRFASVLIATEYPENQELLEDSYRAFLKLSESFLEKPEALESYSDSLDKIAFHPLKNNYLLLMNLIAAQGDSPLAKQLFASVFCSNRTFEHRMLIKAAEELSLAEVERVYFPLLDILFGSQLSMNLIHLFSSNFPSVVVYMLIEKAIETLGVFEGILFLQGIVLHGESILPEAVWRCLENSEAYEGMPVSWWLPLVQDSFPVFENPWALPKAYGGIY